MSDGPSYARLLCALIVCASVVSPLTAREHHVSTYAQLSAACIGAEPGDTITVAPGVYTIAGASRIMINNRPGPVLVRGASGNAADVVIQGAGQDDASVQMVFNLDNSPRWTFTALTTRNSYYHGFKFDHTSTDCVLRNVVMRDHGESGVKGTSDPAAGSYPDRLLVEGCDIGFTATTGGTRSVVEGIDGVGVNDWVVRGCRFVNVQKGGAPAYAVFTKGNSHNTIIEGCTFVDCFIAASFGGGGTAAQFFRDGDATYEHRGGIIRNNVMIRCTDAAVYINKGLDCRIYNNTVFECGLTIQLRFAQTSGAVRNNLVVRSPDNPGEPVVRVRDNATATAMEANVAGSAADFVKGSGATAALDLHLVATSAAVDNGADLGDDVAVDFDGRSRPIGRAYDIGAYEYAPASSADDARAGRTEQATHVRLFHAPAGDRIRLGLNAARAGNVGVTLHDVRGRLVASLLNEPREAGMHRLDLALADDLPAGMYFVRVVVCGATHAIALQVLR